MEVMEVDNADASTSAAVTETVIEPSSGTSQTAKNKSDLNMPWCV